MQRREFLRTAGLLTLSLCLPGAEAWAMRTGNGEPAGRKMIVVFLRGAADGLSIVVPYGDARYYTVRQFTAIPPLGQQMGVLDLDGYFGLHPSLAPLMPQWQNGTLAFVHASGSPDPTRSHFDAQDFMESGTPGQKLTSSGWMNRLLAHLPNTHSPIRAINIGATLPRILQGPAEVASYAPPPAAKQQQGKPPQRKPIDYPGVVKYFESMYEPRQDALGEAFREGVSAHQTISKELAEEMVAANQGAPDAKMAKGFGTQLGKLFAKDPAVQIGFVALGGWDTHVNQGSSKGPLANKLATLGSGLSELIEELGDEYKNTVIVVMSEFGRTVKENGNNGTDHGHGNVMMVMGGAVAGGKVHGDWMGLASNDLYEGRDLAVTTDFRSVLSDVIAEHLSQPQLAMNEIFPGFKNSGKKKLEILRA